MVMLESYTKVQWDSPEVNMSIGYFCIRIENMREWYREMP